MTVQAITAEILRDRDRVPSSHNVVDCFACGRSFLYEGPHGDDSGRFCHQRCREWFDAGNPPYALISVMASRHFSSGIDWPMAGAATVDVAIPTLAALRNSLRFMVSSPLGCLGFEFFASWAPDVARRSDFRQKCFSPK